MTARVFSTSRHSSETWPSDTLLRSDSRQHRELLQRLVYVAQFDRATILLEGESGTGKSALAHQIHLLSPRSGGPFVEVNVAAIDDALVSSELFGHLPGAFTGASSTRRGLVASALGGTLFLDEIGKASRAVQHRLLTLLERRVIRAVGSDREAPVNVRLVAATNVPVSELVEQGVLLSDLAPRLTTHRFRLTPLRDRPQDVPSIARACVLRHYRAYGYQGEPPELDAALVAAMCLAAWPDNIRGLDNAVQQLLVAAEGRPHIGLGDCATEDLRFLPLQSISGAREDLTPDDVEKLVEMAGSISGAARISGRARSTIQRQLDKKDSLMRARRLSLEGDVARQQDSASTPVARQAVTGDR
jgi:DNA-binding NtrC family response regulator